MLEVRIHGRGGQGAVTSAELVALAAIDEGKIAQSMPSFGPERRGAPVLSFLRVSDDEPIRVRYEVTKPDIVMVLDPSLLRISNVAQGLKPGGTMVLNTSKTIEELRSEFKLNGRLAIVNATAIAREILGRPITNTTMIGAMIKASSVVKLDSLAASLEERFPPNLAERNIRAMKKAYEQTTIEE